MTLEIVAVAVSIASVFVSGAAFLLVYRYRIGIDPRLDKGRISAEPSAVQPEPATDRIAQFRQVAETISAGDSFTNTERDLAMRLAREIDQLPNATLEPDFLISLESLIESFVGADLTLHTDALDEMFSSATTTSAEINHALLVHFGLRLLSEEPAKPRTVDRFKRHLEAAEHLDNYQHALPFWIVYQFAQNNEAEVHQLLGQLESLDVVSRVGALQHIHKWGDENAAEDESRPMKLRRAAARIGAFTSRYGEQLEALV